MTNALLIHNNNTSLKKVIDINNQIVFNPTTEDLSENDIDGFISKTIMPQIKEKEFQIIYIKDNLSVNYLDFYGLILAYHIRFELGAEKFVPIVILSEIDAYTINRLTPLGAILFTKNLFLTENSLGGLDKFKDLKLKKVSSDKYRNDFLNFIEVEAPVKSRNHRIDNKWAIYQWAKELKINNNTEINQIIEKLSSRLDFKYLQHKYLISDPIKEIDKEKKLVSTRKPLRKVIDKNEEIRILLIDDEWNKGWEAVFKHIFPKAKGYDCQAIRDVIYKDKKYEDIKEDIFKSIRTYKPDIIILDMRLVDDDHDEKIKPEDISGIQLLNKIKSTNEDTKLNPGIQIIMLSATGRSDILEQANKDNKILGYIKKENLKDKNSNPKENIVKLTELINDGLKRRFLKDIWITQHDILELNILKKDTENFIKIKAEIETIFEILDSYLENKIKFTILTIFKVLEILSDEFKLEGSEFIRITSLFKQNDLTTYSKQISQLVCTRNFLVHSGNKDKISPACINQNNLIEEPEVENILTWFKMLQNILHKIDEKLT